jgi:hypothetical protein
MDSVGVDATLEMLLQVSGTLACIKHSLANLVGIPVKTVKEDV